MGTFKVEIKAIGGRGVEIFSKGLIISFDLDQQNYHQKEQEIWA